MAKSVEKKKKAIKKIEKAVRKAVRKGIAEEDVEQAVDEAISKAPKAKVRAPKKIENSTKVKMIKEKSGVAGAAKKVNDESED